MAQSTTYLSKTYSGNGNLKKGTISVWCKFADTDASADSTIFGTGDLASDSNSTFLSVNGNGFGNVSTRQIIFGLRIGGGTVYKAVSNNIIRDVNGWYHIVVRFDNTLGTPNCDIYLNGEEVSYSSNNWDSLSTNSNTYLGGTSFNHRIGRGNTNAMISNYYEGSMSHFHYCDGYYYAPTEFGETDSTTGEWKIKTSPSVSYGTNGFWFFKDDNALTDHSPNSNSYSLTAGTLTKTEDNPSNVFNVINVLSAGTNATYSNGNTQMRNDTTTWNSALGTLAFGTGKYYFEGYRHGNGGTANVGITTSDKFGGNHSGVDTGRVMYSSNGTIYREGLGLSAPSVATFGDTDIVGVSMDTENGILKFYKNGSLIHTETNSAFSTTEYIPAFACHNGGEWRFNFGNGYFGSTQISSAGNNASGNGIFEYDVQPTDATALSTKGLNL